MHKLFLKIVPLNIGIFDYANISFRKHIFDYTNTLFFLNKTSTKGLDSDQTITIDVREAHSMGKQPRGHATNVPFYLRATIKILTLNKFDTLYNNNKNYQ